MPNSKSAKKRVRQDAKKRLLNRTKSSAVRTAMRRVQEAASAAGAGEEGADKALEAAVSHAYKRIDKAAKANILHANTAARRKALVARQAAAKQQA